MDTEFKIQEHVRDRFDGLLVIGDVHADYKQFKKAADLAKRENYFLLSLGDLVDRGTEPFEVIEHFHSLVQDGLAGLIIGNHDNKMWRYTKGNRVVFSGDALITIDCIKGKEEKFFSMYKDIVEDRLLSSYHRVFDSYIFSHGGFHRAMLDSDAYLRGGSLSIALFGETNGEKDTDGYPIRLYNWIDNIPKGMTAVVGHDRKPVHSVEITEPLVVENEAGGAAMFIDTSCGKGGFLTGALFKHNKREFKLDSIISFKEL